MGRFNIEDRRVITGVDLGTSCVRCVIGVLSADTVELVGAAQAQHRGLSKGRIVNMKETAEAIRQACEEAEVASGLQISQLFLGLGGDYRMFSSQGMSIIASQQVTVDDLNKAVETAKAVPLPTGHRLLHVLPKNFTVDGEGPFFNPLGLSGLRLETDTLMVSIPDTSVQNALQCLRYAGYSARGLVLNALASALSVTDDKDKSSGVCVLDIGQDQTFFTIMMDARVNHIGSLAMGGEDFTHDLMQELQVPRDQAEEIKIQYGNMITSPEVMGGSNVALVEEDDSHSIHKMVDQKIHEVITTRCELLFQELKSQIESLHYSDLVRGGIVLTGRGSYLANLCEIGKSIMVKPVRKQGTRWSGIKDLENKNDYETAVGILNYVQNENTLDYRSDHLKGHVFRIKRWVQDLLP